MSAPRGGWAPHPDAPPPAAPLPRVRPGRIVGVGAVCDLGAQRVEEPRCQDFPVSEFVTLEDGRRVTLHADRGFTIGIRTVGEPGFRDPREHLTLADLTRDVLTTVLPDDDGCAEDHPWPWLAGLARARGLEVTPDVLRTLRYEVVFTDAVLRWLTHT